MTGDFKNTDIIESVAAGDNKTITEKNGHNS